MKFNHWLTSCKSADLCRRPEPGRDEKILRVHRQVGNVTVDGIGKHVKAHILLHILVYHRLTLTLV